MRWTLVLFLALTACDSSVEPNDIQTDTTTINAMLPVTGGSIWYRVTGKGAGIPLIVIHGGPGSSSFYLKPFEQLGDDRRIVRYDQLGAGKSGPASDTTLFRIERFVAELEALRKRLGYSRVHLLGHSWGSIVATEYYRSNPTRVVSLTLASPALDIPSFTQYARVLVGTLSPESQQAIASSEVSGNFAAPAYQDAIVEYFFSFVSHDPVLADLDSMVATGNDAMALYMFGPSDFTVTGTLKTYNATSFLKNIGVRTLFTVGEFDESGPLLVKAHADATPRSAYTVFEGSGHLTPWDAPVANVARVRAFLLQVDGEQ